MWSLLHFPFYFMGMFGVFRGRFVRLAHASLPLFRGRKFRNEWSVSGRLRFPPKDKGVYCVNRVTKRPTFGCRAHLYGVPAGSSVQMATEGRGCTLLAQAFSQFCSQCCQSRITSGNTVKALIGCPTVPTVDSFPMRVVAKLLYPGAASRP